jgi:hypothetical protein
VGTRAGGLRAPVEAPQPVVAAASIAPDQTLDRSGQGSGHRGADPVHRPEPAASIAPDPMPDRSGQGSGHRGGGPRARMLGAPVLPLEARQERPVPAAVAPRLARLARPEPAASIAPDPMPDRSGQGIGLRETGRAPRRAMARVDRGRARLDPADLVAQTAGRDRGRVRRVVAGMRILAPQAVRRRTGQSGLPKRRAGAMWLGGALRRSGTRRPRDPIVRRSGRRRPSGPNRWTNGYVLTRRTKRSVARVQPRPPGVVRSERSRPRSPLRSAGRPIPQPHVRKRPLSSGCSRPSLRTNGGGCRRLAASLGQWLTSFRPWLRSAGSLGFPPIGKDVGARPYSISRRMPVSEPTSSTCRPSWIATGRSVGRRRSTTCGRTCGDSRRVLRSSPRRVSSSLGYSPMGETSTAPFHFWLRPVRARRCGTRPIVTSDSGTHSATSTNGQATSPERASSSNGSRWPIRRPTTCLNASIPSDRCAAAADLIRQHNVGAMHFDAPSRLGFTTT